MGIADKISNKAEELAGKAKEAIGEHNGDEDLKEEGQKDQAKADVKGLGEDIKDKLS